MSTIYLNNPPKPIRPPHSNDCNDHNTSISVGGKDIVMETVVVVMI